MIGKRRIKPLIKNTILFIIFIIIVLGILFPVLWFFALSIKSHRIAFQTPPAFFFRPSLSAYKSVFCGGLCYPQYLMNSIIIASLNTILCPLPGLPAAYSFSRFDFKGRRPSMLFTLVTRMLLPVSLMVPFYILANKLHLIDIHNALILAYMVYNLPFIIWMMKGFLDDITVDFDESALIDSCGRWRAFIRIVLLLSAPGFVVTSILNFIFSWNEFLWASVLTGMRSKTMTVGISAFWTNVSLQWAQIGASSTVFLLPPIAVVIFFRKYVISGLIPGAIKG